MMLLKLLAPVLGFAALSSAAQCNADYCLRALRASQFPTRLPQASLDCSAFLAITSTITVTQTSTISEAAVATYSATNTSVIRVTDTTVTSDTSTVDVTTVSTTVVPVTLTTSLDLLKRDASATIPAYASWCSGAVRFQSACSCIGVSAATLAPISTTVTESTVITVTSTSTLPVTETTSVTTTDSTETLTTLLTKTRTIESTLTETSTKTEEIFPTGTFTSFKIKVTHPDYPSDAPVWLAKINIFSIDYLLVTESAADASVFVLDGTLLKTGGTAVWGGLYVATTLFFKKLLDDDGDGMLSCSFDAYRELKCVNGVNNAFGDVTSNWIGTPVRYLYMDKSDSAVRNYPGSNLASLRAIPA